MSDSKHKHFGYKPWGKSIISKRFSLVQKRIIRSENRKDRREGKKEAAIYE